MFNKVLSNGNDNSNGNTNSPKESETAANGAGDESTAYASADPVQHSIKNITAGFYHHHLGSSAFMTPDFGHNAHFRPYEQYTSSFDYHYQNGSSFKNFPTQPAAPSAGHQPQNFVNHQLKSATETGASFGPSQPSGPPSSSSTASNSMSSSASPALNESPNPAPAVVAALYHSAVNAVSDPIQASKIAAAAAAASSYPYNNSHIHHSMFGLSLPTYPNQADYSSRFYQGDFLSDYEKNSLLQNTTSQTSSSSSSNASSSSIKSSGHLANKLTNSNSSLNGSQSDSSRVNRCRICDKTYARPSTLKTHMRTHSGEKPYKCDKCSKAFTQAANLTAHLRTHSGEKPFSCEICGRKFSQSSSVTTHMRTHSGERPYACKFCRKAFSDSSTLTKHMRVHSGEKPYQCQLCQLRFSQSGNLNRHMRIHQNQQQNQQHHPASNGYAAHMASNMMRNNDNTIEEEDENEESMCSETESQSRIRPDINEEDRFNDYYQRNLRQHQQFQHQQLLYQQQPLLNQPQLASEDSILHTHSSMQPFPSHHLQQQHLHPQFSHQNSNNFGQNFGFNQHQSGLAFGHHFHHQSYLHPSSESADVVAQHAQQLQLQQQLINIRKMECVDYNNN